MSESSGFAEALGHRIAYVRHDAGDGTPIVVMAHGFQSSKIGPSRYFVPLARELASRGISTFRFDQPGCGDSSGDVEESSFETWTRMIEQIVLGVHAAGAPVALLGQSMGGAAAMAATPALSGRLRGLALWSPGVMLDARPQPAAGAWSEESGQRVRGAYWREAAATDFLGCFARLDVPAFVVFGTADDFISASEMRGVDAAAKAGDLVRIIEGMPHSAWPFEHRTRIIAETADFLERCLIA